MRVFAKFLAVVFVVVLAGPASAAIMTFKDLPELDPFSTEYRENGITMTGDGDLGSFNTPPGSAHLDDGGSSFAQFLTFTTERRFRAVGFDILPLPTAFCSVVGLGCSELYDNVQVQGFRDGILVAQGQFSAGDNPNSFSFGDLFVDLDQLVIGALQADVAALGGECFDSPCGHFNIDNVELSPVPLPAALPLLSAALGLLGLLGWRRRRTVAA